MANPVSEALRGLGQTITGIGERQAQRKLALGKQGLLEKQQAFEQGQKQLSSVGEILLKSTNFSDTQKQTILQGLQERKVPGLDMSLADIPTTKKRLNETLKHFSDLQIRQQQGLLEQQRFQQEQQLEREKIAADLERERMRQAGKSLRTGGLTKADLEQQKLVQQQNLESSIIDIQNLGFAKEQSQVGTGFKFQQLDPNNPRMFDLTLSEKAPIGSTINDIKLSFLRKGFKASFIPNEEGSYTVNTVPMNDLELFNAERQIQMFDKVEEAKRILQPLNITDTAQQQRALNLLLSGESLEKIKKELKLKMIQEKEQVKAPEILGELGQKQEKPIEKAVKAVKKSRAKIKAIEDERRRLSQEPDVEVLPKDARRKIKKAIKTILRKTGRRATEGRISTRVLEIMKEYKPRTNADLELILEKLEQE